MSNTDQSTIVNDPNEIAEIAKRIADSGRFAMDLEFMSADRYIPDLALIQLAWEESGELQMALVEGVDSKLDPLFEQVESDSVLLVAHGAKQDLSLLSVRYQVRAGRFVDTQIAAAFAGIAEQIGYANLVDTLIGKRLDKGSQFTNWMRRPLTDKQLSYALDDVRYLLPVWDAMRLTLDKVERRTWALEESALLAAGAAQGRSPELAYKKVGGAGNLKGSSLGALRELVRWREEVAVEGNIPPSWIIPDSAALEVCRRNLKTDRELKKVRGLGTGLLSKYGEQIIAASQKGRHSPVSSDSMPRPLMPVHQAQSTIVVAIVAGAAAKIGMPARSIAAKADAEALVRHSLGQNEAEDCRLLQGWRADFIGNAALEWLAGKAQLLADPKLGVKLVHS